MDSKILIIVGAIIVVLLIGIIIYICVKNKNKDSEKEASILDVDEAGVPNTSELKDFSYGYEKEETIVMDKVPEDLIKEETKKEESEESENDK